MSKKCGQAEKVAAQLVAMVEQHSVEERHCLELVLLDDVAERTPQTDFKYWE